MSIYRKLGIIQNKIKGLSKDKKSHNYNYVSGNKLLSFIKPLMDDYGLLLKQEVLSIDNERMDYKTKYGEKSEILSKVMMKFTWVDVETGEKDENLFGANGQNDWEKGLGSALTYAERYFLLKYFHIPTDADDIDNKDRKTKNPVKSQESIDIPIDVLAPLTLSLEAIDSIESLEILYNEVVPDVAKYPQLKAMFTKKKESLK